MKMEINKDRQPGTMTMEKLKKYQLMKMESKKGPQPGTMIMGM